MIGAVSTVIQVGVGIALAAILLRIVTVAAIFLAVYLRRKPR